MSNQITPNPSVPSQVVQEVKFPKFVNNLGIIPTSYKDSMSYYECLAWLCKYLEETVIPTLNQNGEAVEELQGLYIELNSYVTHYFDTLDVQEEINNKLDDMVATGELQLLLNQLYNELTISVNSQIDTMNNKINAIESGSPAGTYATVAALEASSADHSKIYVVSATGKWYYYDTTNEEWSEGGTYLSTGLSNYSVSQEKTTFLKPKKNYYNKETSTLGGYVNTGNGTIVESANYFYTPYIPVKPNTQYTISGSPNQQNIIGFYDESKTYISGSGHAYTNNSNFTTPASCYYIIESSYKTVIDTIQIEEGAVATAFEDYYLVIDDLIATDIIDDTITPKKTTFLQHTNNYFDKSSITLGKYVNYGNGVLTDNEGFFASDFIEVTPSTEMELAINTLNFQIAFFTTAKTYISGIYYGNSTKKFTTPATAKYLRYSDTRSVLNRNQMLQIGTTTTQFIKCGYEFTDEISLQNNYFEVGEGKTYETLKEGLEEATKYNDSIVYVNEGTYDLYEEFGGDDFFDSYTDSSSKGLTLKNNVHVIFSPNSKVTFNYEGTNEYVNSLFSPFNAGEAGFKIENLNLEATNCRYCIHDERGSSTEFYSNNYINCNLKLDNSQNTHWSGTQTIGGGLGHNGLIEIQNCIIYGGISYHNNNSSSDTSAKSKIIINNVYSKSGSIRMSHCGVSTKLTECIISNNSLPNAITVSYERPGTDVIANMDVYQFNNVIRT